MIEIIKKINNSRQKTECAEMHQYKLLWISVFEQAIKDMTNRNSLIKRQAWNYVLNKKNHDIGSFIWICELLQINADKFREKLMKIKSVQTRRFRIKQQGAAL